MKVELFKILKPGDYIISITIIFSLILYYSLALVTPNQEKIVEITDYQNKIYHYPLTENCTVCIPGPVGFTEIRIENRRVGVKKASCPLKTCKHMGFINREGDVIICIPNRVLIQITGNQNDLDGFSR